MFFLLSVLTLYTLMIYRTGVEEANPIWFFPTVRSFQMKIEENIILLNSTTLTLDTIIWNKEIILEFKKAGHFNTTLYLSNSRGTQNDHVCILAWWRTSNVNFRTNYFKIIHFVVVRVVHV